MPSTHNGTGSARLPEASAASDFRELLATWVGETVTIVNPESFEDAPVGRQLRTGFYRARLTALGPDYLVLATQYVHTGPRAGKEPVRQYVPLEMVKRVSELLTERVIHL